MDVSPLYVEFLLALSDTPGLHNFCCAVMCSSRNYNLLLYFWFQTCCLLSSVSCCANGDKLFPAVVPHCWWLWRSHLAPCILPVCRHHCWVSVLICVILILLSSLCVCMARAAGAIWAPVDLHGIAFFCKCAEGASRRTWSQAGGAGTATSPYLMHCNCNGFPKVLAMCKGRFLWRVERMTGKWSNWSPLYEWTRLCSALLKTEEEVCFPESVTSWLWYWIKSHFFLEGNQIPNDDLGVQ